MLLFPLYLASPLASFVMAAVINATGSGAGASVQVDTKLEVFRSLRMLLFNLLLRPGEDYLTLPNPYQLPRTDL